MYVPCEFIDGKEREFIPYQGWFIIDGDVKTKDVLISECPKTGSIYTTLAKENITIPNDAFFCGTSNGEYVYYTQYDTLFRKYQDGRIENVRTLNHIEDEDIYIDYRYHQKRRLKGKELAEELKKSQATIHIHRRGCDRTENIITKDGYFVFDKWYNWIYCLTGGLFGIYEDGVYHIMDLNEEIVIPREARCINYFKRGLGVIEFEDSYGIIDESGKIIADGYSSVMMASNGIWLIDVYHNKKHQVIDSTYKDIPPIQYIQEFLRSKYGLGLFEKDLTWYYLNEHLEMVPLLRYDIFSDLELLEKECKAEGVRPGAVYL